MLSSVVIAVSLFLALIIFYQIIKIFFKTVTNRDGELEYLKRSGCPLQNIKRIMIISYIRTLIISLVVGIAIALVFISYVNNKFTSEWGFESWSLIAPKIITFICFSILYVATCIFGTYFVLNKVFKSSKNSILLKFDFTTIKYRWYEIVPIVLSSVFLLIFLLQYYDTRKRDYDYANLIQFGQQSNLIMDITPLCIVIAVLLLNIAKLWKFNILTVVAMIVSLYITIKQKNNLSLEFIRNQFLYVLICVSTLVIWIIMMLQTRKKKR